MFKLKNQTLQLTRIEFEKLCPNYEAFCFGEFQFCEVIHSRQKMKMLNTSGWFKIEIGKNLN